MKQELEQQEDYMQKKLKEGRYLIIYCMTEKAAHFFYRIQRGSDKEFGRKGNDDIFFFKSITNQKRAGSVKFLKNCPKTWLILAGAFKRYGNDIMVWSSNRVYNFHLPKNMQDITEKQFNNIMKNQELPRLDLNLNNIDRIIKMEDMTD
jgi:hypothetical protein